MDVHDELVALYRREGSAHRVMKEHALSPDGRCKAGCGGTVQTGHGARGWCSIYAAARAASENPTKKEITR